MTDPSADGMLHLLKAEPTLLPPAPSDDLAQAMDRRRQDEVHACLRCGERAQMALVAHLETGNRWLDLCHGCWHWLMTNITLSY